MKLELLPAGFSLETVKTGSEISPRQVKTTRTIDQEQVRIEGIVSDDGARHISLVLTARVAGQLISGHCSCGQNLCAHMVAAILYAQDSSSQQTETRRVELGEPLEPRIRQWLSGFDNLLEDPEKRNKQYELRYVLDIAATSNTAREVTLQFWRVPMRYGTPNLIGAEIYSIPKRTIMPLFIKREQNILQLLDVVGRAIHPPGAWSEVLYALEDHPATSLLIDHMLKTERLCWKTVTNVLKRGPDYHGQPQWLIDRTGTQSPSLHIEDVPETAVTIFPLSAPWAIHEQELTLSPVAVDIPPKILSRFLSGPKLSPAQAQALAKTLSNSEHSNSERKEPILPRPNSMEVLEQQLPFTPKLVLSGMIPPVRQNVSVQTSATLPVSTSTLPVAHLQLAYGGVELDQAQVASGETVVHLKRGTQIIRTKRRKGAERSVIDELKALGFLTLEQLYRNMGVTSSSSASSTIPNFSTDGIWSFKTENQWLTFLMHQKSQLESKGIEIVLQPSFPLHFAEVDDWYGETEENQNGWFTLDLGIIVDGQRQSLIPILVNLIAEQPQLFASDELYKMDDTDIIFATLADGRRVPLPTGRIRTIINVLVELNLRDLPKGPLKLPLLDTTRLAALNAALEARWLGAEQLLEVGKRLNNFGGIAPVKIPDGLNAELRPYQEQGLAWLQFLREYEMGGILADDMGLGKAQPLDAKVLTPLGWRRMGQLEMGDFVIGKNGQPVQILAVYPQGQRDIYRLTMSDGSSVEADLEHLWAVTARTTHNSTEENTENVMLLSTKELIQRLDQQPSSYFLPLVDPIEFAEHDTQIDHYTLGVLLSTQRPPRHVIDVVELAKSCFFPPQFLEQHTHQVEQLRALATSDTMSQRYMSNKRVSVKLSGPQLGQFLEFWHGHQQHATLPNSDILPNNELARCFMGSVAQRTALLQGLLDRDGYVYNGVLRYSHSCGNIILKVMTLVQSLGGTACWSKSDSVQETTTQATTPALNTNTPDNIPENVSENMLDIPELLWHLDIRLPKSFKPFRLSRKKAIYDNMPFVPPMRAIEHIEYVGVKEAQCIAVKAPDHLYVTEHCIVTHNTLQTLAHLQIEKETGRAQQPSLVVAPTSVIGNWQREAAKFTPELKVLTLHGPFRKNNFDRIADADLILTTYPLLSRDLDVLNQREYHLLILDEAQNIKNAKTAAAKATGSLRARHRLCLTGTPLENHLGELWSQFNFLSPGLLHDEKTFRELYRNPIEKRGEQYRQQALAARVKPFILRREKKQVVQELPPKTEIPVRVSLEGDQRDLYETVRVTTESRVRHELESRGLAQSSITILDALLKLRQAATDPRLVKLSTAQQVKNNAKLTWLQEHLPDMVTEGRRVLIFSSFATLLGHLESLFIALKIPYSKITGQTKDRQKEIDAFQNGETHVFLITLRAGGVGLNLTAADTVIHYDPWWNPAAEDQATDRAYRIGQDKPVFVYKLIAAGSVEERILEMQARKASLAKGVLDGGLSSATQLTMDDLSRLFAPLDMELGDGDLGIGDLENGDLSDLNTNGLENE